MTVEEVDEIIGDYEDWDSMITSLWLKLKNLKKDCVADAQQRGND